MYSWAGAGAKSCRMAPETAWDNLVYVTFVVNEEGWYSLVLCFSEGRQLNVFQVNYLKNQSLIRHPPASVMVDALDHPASGLRAQPLPCE